MFLHSQMTLPVSHTPIFPTITLWRTTTQGSLVLYSSASLVSCKMRITKYQLLLRPNELVIIFDRSHTVFPTLSLSADSLDETGKQIAANQEYVFLFGVFDEKESKYKPNGHASDNHVKYTINGYTEGWLPG